jgi:hypothetical protein
MSGRRAGLAGMELGGEAPEGTGRFGMRGVVLAALAVCGALAGCATQPPAPSLGGTPFQAASGDRFGWREQPVEAGRWQLSFQGNARATRTDVDNALLLRAAQIAQGNGAAWFRLSQRAVDEERVRRSVHDPFSASAWGRGGYHPVWHPHAGWVWVRDPFFDPWSRGAFGAEVIDISRFRASAELTLGTGERPQDPQTYATGEVLANLGPLVRVPGAVPPAPAASQTPGPAPAVSGSGS